MAWIYSDYVTYDRDSATYRSRLRLHVQEVSDLISTEIAADAKSESANNLTKYRQELEAKLDKAEDLASRATNGGVSKIRLGRPL